MESLTIYRASDGKRFDDAQACQEYEWLLSEVVMAMRPLGDKPDLGHGCWKQHKERNCHMARRGLVMIARKLFSHAVFQQEPHLVNPMSIAGRLIDDSGYTCLYWAWNRLMCINWQNWREYDQPFFALNPDQAEK